MCSKPPKTGFLMKRIKYKVCPNSLWLLLKCHYPQKKQKSQWPVSTTHHMSFTIMPLTRVSGLSGHASVILSILEWHWPPLRRHCFEGRNSLNIVLNHPISMKKHWLCTFENGWVIYWWFILGTSGLTQFKHSLFKTVDCITWLPTTQYFLFFLWGGSLLYKISDSKCDFVDACGWMSGKTVILPMILK